MISVANIDPDVALAGVLDKKVIVDTSATKHRKISVYAANKQPNKGLADEFIDIYVNGVTESITKPIGIYKGNLAVAIYVKTQTDGTAKTQRIRQIIEQCETLVNCKTYDGYFFEFDPMNIITPTTTNLTTGYSTTIINVKWRTSQ